ncbi:MAG: hypothetical protein E6G05_07580 [Actinobacteria bacterium]|nr:MAG: hypothetical protein E6G05_07580 [Actinomycetota bacterium]
MARVEGRLQLVLEQQLDADDDDAHADADADARADAASSAESIPLLKPVRSFPDRGREPVSPPPTGSRPSIG